MPDITIPESLVQIVAERILHGENAGHMPTTIARASLRAAAPHIAAQERQRVADEIDLPAVMAHLLRGSRDDLILADRINVAIGASRVRRIEADHG